MSANATAKKVRLSTLQVGQWFKLDEREGFLLYKNDCRARVRLPGKLVQIKDAEFQTKVELDWGPDTEVQPLEVYGGITRRGADEEVVLEPEDEEVTLDEDEEVTLE